MPLRCVHLARGESLIAFHTLAVYVTRRGLKARDRELMYPAMPTYHGWYIIIIIFDLSLF